MSLYNMLHGKNPMSEQLLACLDLTTSDFGRFRDVTVSEGTIAVYTRNGGGNRDCWCDGNPEYGYSACVGHEYQKTEEETIWMDKAEIEARPEVTPLNMFMGDKRMVKTGKQVVNTYQYCEHPGTEDCACPGCTIEYRLPKHPNYIRDEDDDFDSTYATIYFSFPERYKEWLELCEAGKWEPDKKWLDFFRRLESDNISDVEKKAVKNLGDAIEGFLSEK